MKIFLIQLVLPLVTYAIGVFIGRRHPTTTEAFKKFMQEEADVEISHVGYTSAQMGYDK